MINVQNLTKRYGDRAAIEDLCFTVEKGEVVGFLGPNGAGKTTTMKIITGYMAPSSGLVTVGGLDVFEDPIEVKKKLGYLPETPPVYGDMVVKDYLDFVAHLKGVEKSKINEYIDSAIDKTQLGEVSKRLIGNLSKGFRQRVGIAQALVSNPEVLILDEPTVGLDPRQVAEIRKLLNSLRGDHTIILSTHILPEVEATCDRVIIINDGKIIAKDSMKDMKIRARTGRVIRIRMRRNLTEVHTALKGLSGVKSIELKSDELWLAGDGTDDLAEAVAEKVVGMGAGLLELSQPGTGLEDVFIEMTNQVERGE